MKNIFTSICFTLISAISINASAATKVDPDKVGYIVLDTLVTNIINDEPNRMSHAKVDVYITIDSQANLEAAQLYVPELRDAVIFLINQQRLEDIDTAAERQILANKGLELAQAIFLKETGEPMASEFLWGFFAVQP